MSDHKSLLTELSEGVDRYRSARRERVGSDGGGGWEIRPNSPRRLIRWLTPNGGTILAVLLILLTQPIWASAVGLSTPAAPSTSTISYQGRLADSNGDPLTDRINMGFRVYDVPTGGVSLWDELWLGVEGNAVQVSDGLFNVMLGSLNTALASIIQGHDELYLGITVGDDTEMSPRVQLGAVPFSMQALTVPDGSITLAKLAEGVLDSQSGQMELTEDFNLSTVQTSSNALVSVGDPVEFVCEEACTAMVTHRGLVQTSIANRRVNVKVSVNGEELFWDMGIPSLAYGSSAAHAFAPVNGFGLVNLPAGTHTATVEFACHANGMTCRYFGSPIPGRWEALRIMTIAQ